LVVNIVDDASGRSGEGVETWREDGQDSLADVLAKVKPVVPITNPTLDGLAKRNVLIVGCGSGERTEERENALEDSNIWVDVGGA